jgi:hypothetical protein
MRLAMLLITLCATPFAAAAQAVECRTVPRGADRLACYDRAAPPVGMQKPADPGSVTTGSGRAASGPAPQSDTPFADVLAVENGRLNAKTKTICRGC